MNKIVFILSFFTCTVGYTQSKDTTNYRNFVGGQLGGQLNIGLFYERSVVYQKNLLLNTQLGIGLNISGDAENETFATYSIQPGLFLLIGPRPFFFEIGPFANFNKSGQHTFSNLNGWIGIRLINQSGFFAGAGYTPIIYKDFTDASHYGNTWIGVKIGGTF